MATSSHKRVAFKKKKDISFKTEIAALAQKTTCRRFAKDDFLCDIELFAINKRGFLIGGESGQRDPNSLVLFTGCVTFIVAWMELK